MNHPTSNIPFRLAPLAAAGLLLLATAPARAAVIEVGLGPNDCTLVDAVTAANTDAAQGSCPAGDGADDIVLPAGAEFVFVDGPRDNGISANRNALRVNSDIRILGNGSTLRAAADIDFLRLIRQDSGALMLEDLTLTGGTIDAAGGRAGGLHATGDTQTTLRRCTVRGNQGGLLASGSGDLTLIDSLVVENDSDPGVNFQSSGTLRIEGSVFRDNGDGALRVDDGGGGSTVVIQRSSFSGNRGSLGGGIYVEPAASFTMTDSTVVDNEASIGGGLAIIDADQVHLSRNLIAGNRALQGAGREMAVALNGTVTSGGYNIVGVEGDAGLDLSGLGLGLESEFVLADTDIVPLQGLDALVAPLADNGGPTATHALVSGSPAIDAIPSELCGGDVNALDQRGVARPQGAGCDIGAFEAGLLPTALDADAVATVIVRKGLRVTVKTSPSATLLDLANGQPLAGQTVKFSAGNTALCEAQTDANGKASCTATLGGLLGNVLNGGYTATFEGTAQFEGSSAQGTLLKL